MAKLNKKKVGVIAGGVAALAVIGVVATTLIVNGQSAPVTAAEPEGAATASDLIQFDLTSANVDGRPQIDPVPEAIAALEASGWQPAEAGKLTVVGSAYIPPLSFLAEDDNVTRLGSEADFAQLIADGLGALAAHQRLCPFLHLRQHALFLLDRGQCLLNDLGRRFFEMAFAGTAKVVRCLLQRQQGACLLHQRGVF